VRVSINACRPSSRSVFIPELLENGFSDLPLRVDMHFSLHNGIRIPYGGQAGILQTHWHKESGHFPVLPGKWPQKLKLLKALPLRLTFCA